MTKRALLCCVLAFGLHGGVSAQGWSSEIEGVDAPSPKPFFIDWEQQASLSRRSAAWQAVREQLPGWLAVMDERTLAPRYAFGPGLLMTRALPAAEEIASSALSLRPLLAELYSVPEEQLQLRHIQDAGRIWYVHLEQRILGFPVDGGGVKLRFAKTGQLVFIGGLVVKTDARDAAPEISLAIAQERLLAHLVQQGWHNTSNALTWTSASHVVRVLEGTQYVEGRAAWKLTATSESPRADWVAYVDSRSGDVLQCWNDVRHATHGGPEEVMSILSASAVSGTIKGTNHEGLLPSQAPAMQNYADIRLTVNGTVLTTNATGGWNYTGTATTVPITSTFDGPWITGTASTGTVANFNNPAVSANPFDVVFDDTNSTIGERDMVAFANKAHRIMKTHAPTITQMDTPVAANANLTTGTCNAFYSPSANSINFYAAGGSCINTATSASVVEHEYGHGITIRVFSSSGLSVPGHLGEGFSDCVGGACEDTAIVGNGFSGVGTMVRNMNNTCQYPASCGTEIHVRGLVIGGCYWHTRVQFSNAFGAAGKTQMDQYLFRHFVGAPQSEPDSLMEMLLLDDNDANLANGTPNLSKFYQGFTVQHAVPFPIPLVNITHTPLRDTLDQYQPYEVRAQASALGGSPVTSMTLYWRNGSSAAFTSTAMQSLGGTEWRAAIPVQPSGSLVQYYMQASASGGFTGLSPNGGATAPHIFRTFRLGTFWSDGFESASGWVHVLVAGQDDWHNNVHGNPSHAYDPGTAFQGVLTWGNDLVPAPNWNGDYAANANNNITSPTLSCTGRTGVQLVYRRWLTVEDGLYDHARVLVSNNNGSTWTVVWENAPGSGTQHHIDTNWIEHTIPISTLADNQAQVKIRFELVADAGLQFGGWNIDDLKLTAATSGTMLGSSGSTAVGQPWNLLLNGFSGDQVVLAASTVLQGTYYPGLGSLSMNATAPTTAILGTFVVPAGGQLQIPFIVPALVGLTAHFQGVMLPASAPTNYIMSNVVSMTITP